MALFETIICSVNLIEHSEDIVHYTRELAKQNNAKVLVVHALPSVAHLRSYLNASSMVEDMLEDAHLKAKTFLVDFIEKNFKGIETEAVITSGIPSNDLLELADKRCADIIIMGSMSSKGMLSFFNSKASVSVIGKTRIPVMVIPNELDMECTPED